MWNRKPFNVYDNEAKTVLELIKDLGKFSNNLLNDLKNKTDVNGDHKGSWQGLDRPTLSDEGMRSTVEKLENDVTNITNYSIKNSKKASLKEKIDEMIEKYNSVYIPQGVYTLTNTIKLKSNTQIIGDENGKTIINFIGDGPAFTHEVDKEQWGWEYSCLNTCIKNITVEVENPLSSAFILDRIMRCEFNNIKIKGGKYGFLIQSGWTNNFDKLDIERSDIGIKIGDNSYSSTIYQSMINNATNIVNSRIEHCRINIMLGDKGFNGSQHGTNINILNNTIEFASECELEIVSFDGVNVSNNYFECLNNNEEALIKIGYTLGEPTPHPDNNYLMCSNININNNHFCVDKGNGSIVGIKCTNHRNLNVEKNTIYGFSIDGMSSKTIIQNDYTNSVNYLDNTLIYSKDKFTGKVNNKTKHELKPSFQNGWFNGGSDLSEMLKIYKSDNIINVRGVIATDNFTDGVCAIIPTEIEITENINTVVRSRKNSGYADDFFNVEIRKDNKIYITGFTTTSGKVLLHLNLSFII